MALGPLHFKPFKPLVRAFRGSKGANTADPQQDLKISDLRFQKIAEFNTEETEGAEKREL